MPLKRDPNCTLCKLHKTAQYVCLLGQGPRQDVMIIGEAPGKREDDSGKPFVGRSGELLESMLSDQDIDREKVFITNAVSCRPPDNKTPTKGEIKACKKWLQYQIDYVKPKFVLLLGNVPLISITGKGGIKKRRGRPFEQGGIIYLPTFHPSFALRDPRQKWFIEKDIKLFKEIIEGGGIPREKNLDYEIITTRKQFKSMIRELYGTVSFDIETNCLYPWSKAGKPDDAGIGDKNVDAKINTIGFGTKHKQYIIPFKHHESPFDDEDIKWMVDEIDDIAEDLVWVTQNGKFDYLWMKVHYGVDWYQHHDFDTMLAHYILDENDLHGLKYIAMKEYGAPDWDIDGDAKRGNKSLAELALYQAHDLYYTRKLRYTLGKRLFQDGDIKRVFDEILMPCARMFTEIEFDGVDINVDMMEDVRKYLIRNRNRAKQKLDKWGKINWGSPKQVGELLFNSKREGGLGIDPIEKTKSGANSTSESVILRIDHPIADDLLAFRGAKQQLSFFIEGWKPFLVDGVLHPSFKLAGTVTGRLSCEHPNLQQVPRDERIRQLITTTAGWTLVEADLSQIELRIAAELAHERHMLEAFNNGVDVHWLTCLREIERGAGQKDLVIKTAKKITGKKLSYGESIEVLLKAGPKVAEEAAHDWKELRKKAKAINFGYLYGMWWKKFKIYARDNYGVNVSDEQAQASREFYFDEYPDFEDWHKRQRRYANRNGYVRSLSGRKRRLPEAMNGDWNDPRRKEAERQAINSPVQSFANEINLMAAIQLRKEFGRNIVRMCGTVHDSIILKVRNGYVAQVTQRLLQIMQRPDLFDLFKIEVNVPIIAEAKVGPWGIGKGFHAWLRDHPERKPDLRQARRAA